ncbi:hypothetical protein DPMN_135688 [Dreissena polymorpha]|uniref:Uncharacterized protein n=1 Tax=Dreissena polymorpha TaxID=45954 RepID=A0A9D4JD55_DREPO|nr:hypothetical protein DPMN_135688 [Dreissena polymorpha]
MLPIDRRRGQRTAECRGHFLSGYTKHRTLNEAEWRCLPLLVCARLCQSLVYGTQSYSLQPENKYLLTTSYRGWPLLHTYWAENKKELVTRWKRLSEQ